MKLKMEYKEKGNRENSVLLCNGRGGGILYVHVDRK